MPTRRSAAAHALRHLPEHHDAFVARARPRRARTARTGRRRHREAEAGSGSPCTTRPCLDERAAWVVSSSESHDRIRARSLTWWKDDRAADGTLRADEVRFVADGEPALDDGHRRKGFCHTVSVDGPIGGSTSGRERRDLARNEARSRDPRRRAHQPRAVGALSEPHRTPRWRRECGRHLRCRPRASGRRCGRRGDPAGWLARSAPRPADHDQGRDRDRRNPFNRWCARACRLCAHRGRACCRAAQGSGRDRVREDEPPEVVGRPPDLQ